MKLDLRFPPWWTRLKSLQALWLALALWSRLTATLTWWLIDARLRDYRQQTLTTAAVRDYVATPRKPCRPPMDSRPSTCSHKTARSTACR